MLLPGEQSEQHHSVFATTSGLPGIWLPASSRPACFEEVARRALEEAEERGCLNKSEKGCEIWALFQGPVQLGLGLGRTQILGGGRAEMGDKNLNH